MPASASRCPRDTRRVQVQASEPLPSTSAVGGFASLTNLRSLRRRGHAETNHSPDAAGEPSLLDDWMIVAIVAVIAVASVVAMTGSARTDPGGTAIGFRPPPPPRGCPPLVSCYSRRRPRCGLTTQCRYGVNALMAPPSEINDGRILVLQRPSPWLLPLPGWDERHLLSIPIGTRRRRPQPHEN